MSPADRNTAYFIWPAKMPLFQDDFAPQRLAQRQKAAFQAMGKNSLIARPINRRKDHV
jgi:hypothetical protein